METYSSILFSKHASTDRWCNMFQIQRDSQNLSVGYTPVLKDMIKKILGNKIIDPLGKSLYIAQSIHVINASRISNHNTSALFP